jgi:uncharacterized protein (TIGR01777 family)
MKKIVISGASGFVGSSLKKYLSNYEIVLIQRGDLSNQKKLVFLLNNSYAVINLNGANIISRWTKKYKLLLYESRIETTKKLVDAMKLCTNKPKSFISTSAIGIYKCNIISDEYSLELNNNFLANLCKDWEKEAFNAKKLGIRVSIFRLGIVLGENAGALSKMLGPFKLGLGGTIGNGKQNVSFIHISDLLLAYKFVINNDCISGIFNLTAPISTTNYHFTKILGKALNRPTLFPIPKFILYLVFGSGASVLTDGHKVLPSRLLENGFMFKYQDIENTIQSLVK